MESTTAGDLVKVATGGPELDGIVFDVPSHNKAVVAIVDSGRGPVFRTVNVSTLSERTEESADDAALRLLIRRTPQPVHSAARGGGGTGQGRSAHTRAAAHRATGR
jgi:hypothetical protein